MSRYYCPRCGEWLSDPPRWLRMPFVPVGHLPAYRMAHRRRDGSNCIVYAGPPVTASTRITARVVH